MKTKWTKPPSKAPTEEPIGCVPMNNADTPRTNGSSIFASGIATNEVYVNAEFARTLERELGAAETHVRICREATERERAARVQAESGFAALLKHHLASEITLAQAMKEREQQAEARLAEALDHIRWLQPMAKGYAFKNPVGSNQEICTNADTFLSSTAPPQILADNWRLEKENNALELKLETAKGALNFITRCKDPIESTGYVMQEKAREALSKLNSA